MTSGPAELFEDHLSFPRGRGHAVDGGFDGAAGGAACGDLVRITLRVEGERVANAGFEASGCGAAIAAGSAAVELAAGRPVLEVARVGPATIATELGGLSPGKLHAADLAADALHVALGKAVAATAALPPPSPAGRLAPAPEGVSAPSPASLAASAPARLSAPSPGGSPPAGRVLVAMSGGVDSAVAALLCARAGDEVVAVTLELWRDVDNDSERSCCSASAVRHARSVAHSLGLPHLTLDLREEFRSGVVEPWLADHAAGLTPNPCIRCNGSVRLDAMLELADRLGASALATGHYARVGEDGLLRPAADDAKDQTYMLAGLAPASIARLRFPLGELTKPEVRALAEEAGLSVARKPDSQDLCFLAGTGKAAFLSKHGGVRERPGDIVDRRGRVLGRHRGHHGYTVGQRRGIRVGGAGDPLYVLATDARTNTVTVGPREELATTRVPVRAITLHRPEETVEQVKLRYRSKPLSCRLRGDEIELTDPVDGAAPGQTAVFLAADGAIVGTATIA